jgi:hypothetical protein
MTAFIEELEVEEVEQPVAQVPQIVEGRTSAPIP